MCIAAFCFITSLQGWQLWSRLRVRSWVDLNSAHRHHGRHRKHGILAFCSVLSCILAWPGWQLPFYNPMIWWAVLYQWALAVKLWQFVVRNHLLALLVQRAIKRYMIQHYELLRLWDGGWLSRCALVRWLRANRGKILSMLDISKRNYEQIISDVFLL